MLATSPRVTRFRIDWSDQTTETMNEDTENQTPTFNTESESNQMAIDVNSDSSVSAKLGTHDVMMGPPMSKQDSSQISCDKVIFGASSTDSNSMPLTVMNGVNG